LDLPNCRGVRASALSPVSHSGGVTLPRATRKASGSMAWLLLPLRGAARHKFLRLGVSRHLGAVPVLEGVPAPSVRNATTHTGFVPIALTPVVHLSRVLSKRSLSIGLNLSRGLLRNGQKRTAGRSRSD